MQAHLNPRSIAALAILWATLAGIAETQAADLAVALAYSIAVSTAMLWGIPALENVRKAVS